MGQVIWRLSARLAGLESNRWYWHRLTHRTPLPQVGGPGTDVEELDHRGHVRVEDEAPGVSGDRVALLHRVGAHVVRQHAGHVEERLRVLVRQDGLAVREADGGAGVRGRVRNDYGATVA